ncbi:ATP-binding protein [Marinicella litoralis]|uniref:histidine kinase n=1 Tax=Marinicella litoralis TaxID=644220 RepID=A0A4R6Y3Q2_9GAMM|nr:ATP-binding protein [Marinicella litoralis]TDR23708.1 two-component system sensor histidine kinase BaeS [Marinicella litoralis]
MKLTSIKSKVVLLFLTITVVVVLSMSMLMKFGFNQEFTKYKKSLAKELNDRMVNSLEAYYEDQQSWSDLVDDPRKWHELVYNSVTDGLLKERAARHPSKRKEKDPSHRRQEPHQGPPPRRPEDSGKNHKIKSEFRQVLPSYSLFDVQQEKIIGPAKWHQPSAEKIKIKNQGQTVGYLVYEKSSLAGHKQDKKFNQTIWMVLLMVTGVMLLVALLFTIPVSNYLIHPIRLLNQATQKAAAGDYSARTSIARNDELGQLGQNFNVLTDTLRSNAEVHQKMMADISHELRTPVAVLLAEIEAIQDGIHHADAKNLNLLHHQTSALKHLINDLHQLSLTELGSMQYKMQSIDINALLQGVVQAMSLAAEKKQLNIKSQWSAAAPKVMGDTNRLEQMFTNLMTNSISYTDAGGDIEITTEAVPGGTLIQIQDSAPGLLAHEMGQMFDRLYRKESSRNKKLGGSGLGLAITKNIVEAHHGEMTAEPSELGGVKITVKLPEYV